jgi:CBS domain-containing protein
MVDAVGEAGNLLIGSWDRVFRDGLKKHGHFLQRLPAFIGKPWDNSEETIGLSSEEDFIVVLYEMTIASYPPFTCGVIFPKEMLGSESSSASNKEQAAEEEPKAKTDKETIKTKSTVKKSNSENSAKANNSDTEAQAKEPDDEEMPAEESDSTENPEQIQSEDGNAPVKANKKTKASKSAAKKAGSNKSAKAKKAARKKDTSLQPDAEEASDEQTEIEDIPGEVETRQTVEDTADDIVEQDQAPDENDSEESQSQEAASAEQDTEEPQEQISDEATEEKPVESPKSEKPAKGKISEAIRKMAQSPAVLPGVSISQAGTGELFTLCAGNIMQADVIWADPEESVQQALSKMQQNDTGYILIGRDGALEGIASRSDVTGAISPYLRSVFAKWRRPLDDATLKIKVKWIMSRPVRTVKPEASLAAVMEHMCRFGGRAIPVVDEEGQVQGLITVFDILQALLQTGAGISTAGKTPQEPPLA